MIHCLLALLIVSAEPSRVEVVEWSAHWCIPCGQIRMSIERLRREGYAIRVVDADKHEDWYEQQGIKMLPTIQFMKRTASGTKEIARLAGAYPYKEIKEAFTRWGVVPRRQVH